MRGYVAGACIALLGFVWIAQAQVVSGGKGARLGDIAGTDTLVTVVLKGSGAEDANLKIESVRDGLITVLSQNGERNTYRAVDIQEIRVQGEVVSVRKISAALERGLTTEQQEIVDLSVRRAQEVFDLAAGNQAIKMIAAEVLMVGGDTNAQTVAQDYLKTLAEGNDLKTALDAAYHLAIAGAAPANASALVGQGLESGDRTVRAQASRLAASVMDDTGKLILYRMLRDRAWDISVPAATTLAILGDREIVPTLLTMVMERTREKAEAAVFALIRLGGDDIIEQMKLKLKDAEGETRFRIARVLYELGDPMGAQLLRDEMLTAPSLEMGAAYLLGRDGDPKAMQILRNKLAQKYDPVVSTLIPRAYAAAALVEAGDRTNAGQFQDLLRTGIPEVQFVVLSLLSALDVHALIPITQPAIVGQDLGVAVSACRSTVAMAYGDYANRLHAEDFTPLWMFTSGS